MSNVLSDSAIVALVFAVVQFIKPLLALFIPADAEWQNNAVRAAGFMLTYVAVVVNTSVQHTLALPELWGLLPIAGALYSSSALLYHMSGLGSSSSSSPSTNAPAPVFVPVTRTIGGSVTPTIIPAPAPVPAQAPEQAQDAHAV